MATINEQTVVAEPTEGEGLQAQVDYWKERADYFQRSLEWVHGSMLSTFHMLDRQGYPLSKAAKAGLAADFRDCVGPSGTKG